MGLGCEESLYELIRWGLAELSFCACLQNTAFVHERNPVRELERFM